MIMIPPARRYGPGPESNGGRGSGQAGYGAEFERMAQIYSEDGTRDLGGDWGWIDRGTLAPPLEKVAFNMRLGKVSNIIESAETITFLKSKKGRAVRPAFAEARHEIEKKLLQEEAQRCRNAGSPVCARKLTSGYFDSVARP